MTTRIISALAAVLVAHAAGAQSPAVAVTDDMVRAAQALVQSVGGGRSGTEQMLGTDRARSLQLPLDDAQRENWAFWPTARVGLPIEQMTAAQRKLVHELLTATLSAKGYLKTVHIMQLEQILDVLDEGGLPRSVDHYVLILFGTPANDAAWAWRFEGHHVSLSVAVEPGVVGVTPSFFGSNPAEVQSGPLAGFRVHGVVEDLARDLVTSFDAAKRRAAVVADAAPSEIFTANLNKPREQWDAWRTTLEPQGVRVGDLNEVQQRWVELIVDEVIGNYRPEIAAAYRNALDVDALHFAWMGSTERGEPHYFRLQGGDFVYEYDNVQNDGNHVHSVWRNASADFEAGPLERHYQTSHR